MQKQTSRSIKFLCLKFFLTSVIFFGGCFYNICQEKLNRNSSLMFSEEELLYKDLTSRVGGDINDLSFSYKGIYKCLNKGKINWIVWMTESSPVGEGVIGVYDGKFRFRNMRITRPIKSIKELIICETSEILIINELYAQGTGLYKESLCILDINDLNNCLWFDIVRSWEEGLEERNEGHLINCFVIELGGKDCVRNSFLVIKTKQKGIDLRNNPLATGEIECNLLSIGLKNGTFKVEEKPYPKVIYPDF